MKYRVVPTVLVAILASAVPTVALAASHGKVLYVGILSNSTSSILEYERRGSVLRQVGQITQGVDQPFGLFVDARGDLYAANLAGGTVTVYGTGSAIPMRTLTGAGHPDAVTVARDGTVYVNHCGYCLRPHHRSAVLEYASGSSVPTRTVHRFTQAVYNTGIAVDAANTLYVAYYAVDGSPSTHRGAVLAFANAGKHGRDVGIRVGSTGGLTIDSSGDLVLADQGSGSAFPAAIDVFAPGASSPVSQIADYAYRVTLAAHGTTLWASDAFYGHVVEYTYPQGAFLVNATVPGVTLGVAVAR